jgi:hypothetical protein
MQHKERYEQIPGYDVEVSSMGRIRTASTGERIKTARAPDGRIRVYIGERRYTLARLVAAMFCNKPEGYDSVYYRNSDKSDIRAANLGWQRVMAHRPASNNKPPQ